jgi:RNA polymerase sigma-70 factor, ECF subfamily
MSVLAILIYGSKEGPATSVTGPLIWLDDWFRPVVAQRPTVPSADLASPREGEAASDAAEGPDWDDVRDSLRGDGEAYGRIVRRYEGRIASYMWRFTRDRRQWEELVNDVFVEAYLSLRSYRGRAPLLHWLRTIATRVGYRWWKQRARQQANAPLPIREWDQAAATDDRAASADEAAALVHAVLATLPVRDRLVLTLLYLEECSVAQAAQLTGWSQAMVKVQAFRARKKLKRSLEQARARQ